MKIIVDENMPNAEYLFSRLGDVELVNGRTLTREQVKDADVLLVRSVTKVTKDLLTGSRVQFVGSATIGVDHIDLDYLQEAGVAFSNAPGCNAEAVADYVFSGLSYLHLSKKLNWLGKKIGVIGYGNVGQKVYSRFAAMGCQVCVYDPFKEEKDSNINFTSLEAVLACDVISLHAPLTKSGSHPTQGMLGEAELNTLNAGTTIISAGRGGVIDESALLKLHRRLGGDLNLILDVWQDEPNINQQLVSLVDIATPHIAGYSKQGREKGSWMVYKALCEHFDIAVDIDEKDAISSGWCASIDVAAGHIIEEVLARSMHAIYDVARDDSRLRFKYREAKEKNVFDWLRKSYVERDEFNTCAVTHGDKNTLSLLGSVGFVINNE